MSNIIPGAILKYRTSINDRQIHYGNDRGRCSYSCYGCSFKVSNLKRAKFRRNQVSSQECTEQSPLQVMPRGCYKITFNGRGVKNATATWVPLCIRHVQATSSMNKLVGAEQQAQSATMINLCVPNTWLTSLMWPLMAKERMVVVGGNAKRLVLTKVKPASLRTNPSGDRLCEGKSLDVEVRPLTTCSDSQAPIKTVDGRPWSRGVYRSLCLLGKTLEVVWVRAFI